ncbi:unnamed protein product [Meloidogyne enterolobii]|uniref:Uncharacterized protein n=2 Tax=Meloidogyne enterolobii TaxID=390850 RepID=A0ACB1B4A2_MELEN
MDLILFSLRILSLSRILVILNLKINLINARELNKYDGNPEYYSLFPSFPNFPKNLLRSLTNSWPSSSFKFDKNTVESSDFISSSSSKSSSDESKSSSSIEKEDNEETDETEEEEKREKAWMEALKKSKTLDLLQQRRHTGDIVQLWDEERMKMRNALRSDSNFRWTRIRDKDGKYVIPFIITGRFTRRQRATIKKAMDKISDNTCVKFRPRRRNENDYVDIQNKINEGCYTTVGQIRGRQVLMLESGWEESCGWGCLLTYPGCTDHSTVIHELMHKVGLWHEQMRYDRDKYIKIHWENIIPGLENQFGKIGQIQSTTYNLPYDYKSVMQYKKNAGARKENLVTMETIDKRYTDVIGNSKDASSEDYKKICSIYKCSKCMGKKFKPLKNRRR